jgi:hypothetical protein
MHTPTTGISAHAELEESNVVFGSWRAVLHAVEAPSW